MTSSHDGSGPPAGTWAEQAAGGPWAELAAYVDGLERRKHFAREFEALGVEPVVAWALSPLLVAADRAGVSPAEAVALCTVVFSAAEREGLSIHKAFVTVLKHIESGEYARLRARDEEAQRDKERFDKTADEYRERYKAGKGALTFDEAVATFGLLPREGGGRDGVAFPLMFSSILEGFELYGKRKGIKVQWKLRFVYRELLARVEGLAYAQGDEAGAEWAKSLRARGTRLKEEGAARRPPGRRDPYDNIAWDMLVGHALLSLSGCGMRVTARDENPCLARAMAVASGIPYRAIKRAWERYPLRDKHERNHDPEMPSVAPGVQCAQCGDAGKVPVFRAREGGSRLCTDCCEW